MIYQLSTLRLSQRQSEYFNKPKPWMTVDILEKILCKLNKQLRSKDRFVLLFMDNDGCHPPNITEKFSNIKIVFLPPNTTSVLQPLDLGIIQNFKVHYRKLLMTFVLAKIETCSSASELLKSVNVLHAIRWVGEAWKNVKVITNKKCFRKCGVLRKDFSIVQPVITAQTDPFADIDIEELSELILSLQGPENACSLSELQTEESDIPVCSEFADLNGMMSLWLSWARKASDNAVMWKIRMKMILIQLKIMSPLLHV